MKPVGRLAKTVHCLPQQSEFYPFERFVDLIEPRLRSRGPGQLVRMLAGGFDLGIFLPQRFARSFVGDRRRVFFGFRLLKPKFRLPTFLGCTRQLLFQTVDPVALFQSNRTFEADSRTKPSQRIRSPKQVKPTFDLWKGGQSVPIRLLGR